jgi:hypothetical protein
LSYLLVDGRETGFVVEEGGDVEDEDEEGSVWRRAGGGGTKKTLKSLVKGWVCREVLLTVTCVLVLLLLALALLFEELADEFRECVGVLLLSSVVIVFFFCGVTVVDDDDVGVVEEVFALAEFWPPLPPLGPMIVSLRRADSTMCVAMFIFLKETSISSTTISGVDRDWFTFLLKMRLCCCWNGETTDIRGRKH